ncbi:AAA family ATPase [uncultured Enterobacter sp.]|uniref:AAA family ATPase n=1 Tax=uncultured Enterobacter sp. TaxID=238202 RepID=UPI0025FDF786|nr:AAA family ATPase [uncultured Enterobacter sp.]
MKILSIEVGNLFGIFNHRISLMSESNITIVIGENGLGKTIILEAIDSFFNKRFNYFKSIEFDFFTITFDNDEFWRIDKKVESGNIYLNVNKFDQSIKKKPDLGSRAKNNAANKTAKIKIDENVSSRKRAAYERKHIEELELINYLNHEKNRDYESVQLEMELMNLRRLELKYGKHLGFFNSNESDDSQPKWFTDALEKINVRLIETQRIITAKEIGGDSYVNSVQKCSAELLKMITDAVKLSSDITSGLDSTYPNRLINKLKQGTRDTFEELNIALKTLDDRRKVLSSVGLGVDTKDSDILQIDDTQSDLIKLLKLYIDDSHEKIKPFDELSIKLKLFQDIINKRFKHKILQINRVSGLNFKSTVKKDKKNNFEVIPASKLSSGEQNELILFYKLIFNSHKGDMILIDEPELSLHISWQNEFIADLKEVTEINDVTVIIATHSPDIINDNWGLKVELRGVE